MDMTKLPALALDRIVGKLEVRDMLNCSMTSSTYRNVLNQDNYWKQLCLKNYKPSLFSCLRDRPCLVKPAFEVPVVHGSNLEPVCEWRIHYMRVQHLKRNRQLGKYFVQRLGGEVFRYVTEIEGCNGDMIYYKEKNELKVVNVAGTPYVQTTLTLPFLNASISLCHLTQDKPFLVLVQGNVLQVSTQTGNNFVLKYRRLFNKPEVQSKAIPDTTHIDKWYDAMFPKERLEHVAFYACSIFGLKFVGVCCQADSGQVSLYAWNLNTGRKEKEIKLFKFPEKLLSLVRCFIHDFGHGKVLVDLQIQKENQAGWSNIFIFSFTSCEIIKILNFSPLHCVLECGLAVACVETECGSVLKFYDISTGNPTLRKCIPYETPHVPVTFHDPYFMYTTSSYAQEGNKLEVTLLNTKTMQTVNSFSVNAPNSNWYFVLLFDGLTIVNRLIVFRHACKNGAKDEAEIWKGDNMSYTLPMSFPDCKRFRIANAHYTKLCFESPGYGYYIFNFW